MFFLFFVFFERSGEKNVEIFRKQRKNIEKQKGEKVFQQTHKGVALDVSDSFSRHHQRPESSHRSDDQPQTRRGPGPAAGPNEHRRRRRGRRSGDGQRQSRPASGPFPQEGALIEILAQDGDGKGSCLLGDRERGLRGDVGLFERS